MSDFNDYLTLNDKIGGDISRCPSAQFQNFLDAFALHPINALGNPYTWTNKQKQQIHTQERLDWGISNDDWDPSFPSARLLHGDFYGSDHRPLIHPLSQGHPSNPNSRFIFDNTWISEARFEDCLRQAWAPNNATNGQDSRVKISVKLQNVFIHLKQWKKSLGSSLSHQNQDIQSQLKNVNAISQPSNSQLALGRTLENDSLLFSAASSIAATTIKDILHDYSLASGQMVNYSLKKFVCDGSTISIFNDAWIPGYGKLNYLKHLSDGSMVVADLITPTKEWNIPKIHNIFPDDISQAIITILLTPFPTSDTHYWSLTPHGTYTVNSGYHKAHNLICQLESTPSDTMATHKWWKMMWTQPLPPQN
uniref:Uncharacterized protein n=1 Tax=Cannabis sativa TaxID=3483 RepID=A0A803PDT5_CANSA